MAKKNLFSEDKGSQLDDFSPQSYVKELEIVDLIEGSGAVCGDNSQVKAHYKGALCKTGVIFESSYDSGKPLMFRLHEVIQGWSKGMAGMKVGGKRRLVIPANMAYGSSSPSKDIPKNSDLVFDIELTDVI